MAESIPKNSSAQPPPSTVNSFAMDESVTESSIQNSSAQPPSTSAMFEKICKMSAEELVAKAIAPVKKEFLRPPPSSRLTSENDDGEKKSVVAEKKSKRSLRRERHNERLAGLCSEVAKTEDVNSCRFGDKCRFSHDLEAYRLQKPADLEGECPFITPMKRCPYGASCRFSGTHKPVDGDTFNDLREDFEVNSLRKDVQKLLWKNKMKFPKSNTALKQLGLTGKGFTKVTEAEENGVDQSVSNGSHCAEDNGCEKDNAGNKQNESSVLEKESDDGISVNDGGRPLKKAKAADDEKPCSDDVKNGDAVMRSASDDERQITTENILPETDASLKLHPRERKLIDFRGKLYLAPLTTVGNLPFRRVCKGLGADVTCGEMAMCTNLLQGQASEWALLRRHKSEDLFGVQICGAYPDVVGRAAELIDLECSVDFIDINMGCPIDLVVNKGAGSALITKPLRMKNVIQAACASSEKPITLKVRTGYIEGRNRIDSMISDIYEWGASAITIHGRSRQQRYSKLADWGYIYDCVRKAPSSFPVLGNGDVFSYQDWNTHLSDCPELSSCMVARGALIKPWLFTEIKEQRHWDISSSERLDILRDYVRFGLEHWGSDTKGVETTRHFLLEWMSYMFRYVPVGLLEVVPQKPNWRPPSYFGRNDLETMMASESAADWIRISEMLLGKVPDGFTFAPKHKSNAYDSAENG